LAACERKANMRIVSSSKDNKQFFIDLIQLGNNEFQAIYTLSLNKLCGFVKNVEELTET
jgi:hypothetical protein